MTYTGTMPGPEATAPRDARRYKVKNKDGSVIGSAVLRMVPVADIKIDPSYQRDAAQQWVHEHMPFNPQKCGAIIVSHRGGALYAIDGQHRILLASASNVPQIPAMVCEELAKKEEAGAFVDFQQERRGLTSWALYRAELVAEREEASAIEAAVLRSGFKIRRRRDDDRTILTVDSLRKTYRLGGGARDRRLGEMLIEDTLRWIEGVWLGEDGALSAQAIYGLALFIEGSRPRPEWDDKYLHKAMESNGPSKMIRHAQTIAVKRKSASMSAGDFAEALLEQYNKSAPDGRKLADLTINSRKRPRPAS